MDTNVEALKGLYVVLGGNIEDVEDITLISDMITEIAKVASTSGDAGAQIIPTTYKDGKCQIDDYDFDKLKADVLAGKVVGVLAKYMNNDPMVFPLFSAGSSSIVFASATVTATGSALYKITYTSANNGTLATVNNKALPEVSSFDNGMYLKVVNGIWDKSES